MLAYKILTQGERYFIPWLLGYHYTVNSSIKVHEIPVWDKVLLNSLLIFDLSGGVSCYGRDLLWERGSRCRKLWAAACTSASSVVAGVEGLDEFTWLRSVRGTKWCWKTASHPSFATVSKAEAIDVDGKKKTEGLWRGILIARTCAGTPGKSKYRALY